jgi:AmmeMemoRadiSam system protein A
MAGELSRDEKLQLLRLARQGLEAAVNGHEPPALEEASRTPALERPGCSFVTLTELGELRGCIGGLVAEQPLWLDVQQRAAQAALRDYRFVPVQPDELPDIGIEVSVLTPTQPLAYESPEDLKRKLRPGVDGVVLRKGLNRATFLPQVWHMVPDPEQFLSMLCQKLGAKPDAWRRAHLDVEIYQVEEFSEPELRAQPGIDQPAARSTP